MPMADVLNSHGAQSDVVMFFALGYLAFDLLQDWNGFGSCQRPVHVWLLVSYAAIAAFRAAHIAGARLSQGGGSFLLNIRQKGVVSQVLTRLNWVLGVPFFAAWTLLGTAMVWDVRANTPACLPEGTNSWFLIVWQAISYVWTAAYVWLGGAALRLEWRVRAAEADLRALERPDVLARWGQVSALPDYTALPAEPGPQVARRLRPSQIEALPCCRASAQQVGTECSICLSDVGAGEEVRHLVACGHTYHRACIDLWLLRNADCPLCKREVVCSTC